MTTTLNFQKREKSSSLIGRKRKNRPRMSFQGGKVKRGEGKEGKRPESSEMFCPKGGRGKGKDDPASMQKGGNILTLKNPLWGGRKRQT